MTVTDQAVATDLPCLCGCPKWRHKRGTDGCQASDCGCDRYEADEKAAPVALALPTTPDPLRAEAEHLREQNGLLRDAANKLHRAEAENERLNRTVTTVVAERDTARTELKELGNELAELRQERDEYEEALHATRQMAIQANAALRAQLLEALGQQDDDRTPLSGYVAALVGELAKVRQQLVDAEAALVESHKGRRLSNAEHLHQRIAAASLVIARFRDWRYCPLCRELGEAHGARHACGRLIPVDVIIARRPEVQHG